MIALTLTQIAAIVDGTVVRGGEQVVRAPVVVDSRRVEPGGLFVAVVGEHSDGHDHAAAALRAGAVGTVATREVAGPCVLVADPVAALTALATEVLARLRRAAGAPVVVAVTGSHGKTSVKDLIAHVLEAEGPTVASEGSFNNELGVPLTVLRTTPDTRWLVLEMGARGPGHLAHLCRIAPPDVSVVVNVGQAHVGEFGSVEAIAEAKGEIVEALHPDGIAVLNADDPRVAAMADRSAARVIEFGHRGQVAIVGDVALDANGHPEFTVRHDGVDHTVRVPQVGFHHGINAAAAFAVARACGVPAERIVDSLAGAGARSAMRMERSVTPDGIVLLNDAYNANPDSMRAALRSLVAVAPGRSIAVLGQMLELGPSSAEHHRQIGRYAADIGVDEVLAVGPGAEPLAAGARERGRHVPTVDVAVGTLRASLREGDTVLVKASRGVKLEEIVHALSH